MGASFPKQLAALLHALMGHTLYDPKQDKRLIYGQDNP